MIAERCESCRFWFRYEGSGYDYLGKCRRFPPNVSDNGLIQQPTTKGKSWCGEFSAASLEERKP